MSQSKLKIITNGILTDNPTFVQCIGLCPTLATTTSVANGIGMGIAATFVLTASNIVISILRKIVPDEIRIPIFIVVIAGFVTVIEFLMKGFTPELNKSLGIFIPLSWSTASSWHELRPSRQRTECLTPPSTV